jgi:hypothetical protein
MNNKTIIGIDGGLNGGICVLSGNTIVEKMVMPTMDMTKSKKEYDAQRIIEVLRQYPEAEVVLEKAHAMPLLGSVQAFRFGLCYGQMLGILSALEMRYHIVHAKSWQGKLFKDQPSGDTKAASGVIARRLFPKEDFTASPRAKKIHDGLTDATLIAYYGQNYL